MACLKAHETVGDCRETGLGAVVAHGDNDKDLLVPCNLALLMSGLVLILQELDDNGVLLTGDDEKRDFLEEEVVLFNGDGEEGFLSKDEDFLDNEAVELLSLTVGHGCRFSGGLLLLLWMGK